jgi:AraC-like DNA-binding protein
MSTYINHLQIANGLLCLLLAAQLLFMRALRPTPMRVLGCICLLYAHQSLMLVATLTGHTWGFSFMRPLVAMLLGPAMYVYFCTVRRPNSSLQVSDTVHLTFGVVVFALLYIVKPLRFLIDYAILASFFTYLMLISLQIRSGKQALAHLGNFAEPAYRWLISLLLISLISIVFEIAVTIEMKNGGTLRESVSLLVASCSFLIVNISTMLATLYRSNLLEWMYQFGEQSLPKATLEIDQQIASTILQRWEALVKTENLHKQEFGITLSQAARKLQVPARQLSNAINQVYGKSFSVYLNDQRIQEAQRLLLENRDMPIIDVMQESGFSSKSNFNKEFLRVVGMSPSAFREGI